MFTQLYTQYWLDLPKETKAHLVKIFNIPKTGITEVRDQTVVQDGHTNDDLKAVTCENMAAYVGSPADVPFHRLWEITLAKVHYELHPPVGTIGEGGLVSSPNEPTVAPVKKYCDTCVSTAGRHRKGCPKYK